MNPPCDLSMNMPAFRTVSLMKYSKVYIDSIGYEIAPVVVSSVELERRLEQALRRSPSQRRSARGLDGNRRAPVVGRGLPALGRGVRGGPACAWSRRTSMPPTDRGLDLRRRLPRTFRAGDGLPGGVADRRRAEDATSMTSATPAWECSTGMVEIANRIELGQIRAGMVVAVRDGTRDQRDRDRSDHPGIGAWISSSVRWRRLTGGSGAVAVLLTDGSFSGLEAHRAPGRSGPDSPAVPWALPLGHRAGDLPTGRASHIFTSSRRPTPRPCSPMASSWASGPGALSCGDLGWTRDEVDKVICHQVGSSHRESDPQIAGDPRVEGFFRPSLPGQHGHCLAAADGSPGRGPGVLESGDRVAFLGIGSGLNCMMLGLQW